MSPDPRITANSAILCRLAYAALAFILINMAQPQFAHAQSAGVRYGSVVRLFGEVTATRPSNGTRRVLRLGDIVYAGEEVRAGSSAEAVLRLDDGGMLAVRPQAQFVVERFAAERKPTDQFSLRLLQGGLRIITGWIGRSNRANYRIQTLTATIGIRGTDHEPYEVNADLADEGGYNEGTYDKVNRGGTTLEANGGRVDVPPGKVGFARVPPKPGMKQRGLMTITLPVLLAKVPGFFVPGRFDDELDRFSIESEKANGAAPDSGKDAPQVSSSGSAPSAVTPSARTGSVTAGACVPQTIARNWLNEFDSAVARHDAAAVIAKFAPDVAVRITVRTASGELSTVEMGRDELAQSTVAAVRGLTDYVQRRPSIEAQVDGGPSCTRISVKSVSLEQGRQNGSPYRFESIEEYLLELRGGNWLAIAARAAPR